MADLAMLLLIFFLTTTYFQAEAGPVVALPPAAHGEEQSEEGSWALHLEADGTLTLQGRRATAGEVAARVREGRESGQLVRLFVHADRALPFGTVYPILGGLAGEEPLPVLLVVEPSPEARSAPGAEAKEVEP
jgi:biopolymer transport protein ExbD